MSLQGIDISRLEKRLARRRSCIQKRQTRRFHLRRTDVHSSPRSATQGHRNQLPLRAQETTLKTSCARLDQGSHSPLLLARYLPSHLHRWYRLTQTRDILPVLPSTFRLVKTV